MILLCYLFWLLMEPTEYTQTQGWIYVNVISISQGLPIDVSLALLIFHFYQNSDKSHVVSFLFLSSSFFFSLLLLVKFYFPLGSIQSMLLNLIDFFPIMPYSMVSPESVPYLLLVYLVQKRHGQVHTSK